MRPSSSNSPTIDSVTNIGAKGEVGSTHANVKIGTQPTNTISSDGPRRQNCNSFSQILSATNFLSASDTSNNGNDDSIDDPMTSGSSADEAPVDLNTLDSIALDFPLNVSTEFGVDGNILNLEKVNQNKYSEEETVENQKFQKRHIDEKIDMESSVAPKGELNEIDVTRKRTAENSIKHCHASSNTSYSQRIYSTQIMGNVGNVIEEPSVPFQAHGKLRPTISSVTSSNMAASEINNSGSVCQSYSSETLTSSSSRNSEGTKFNLMVKSHPQINLSSGTKVPLISNRLYDYSMDNTMRQKTNNHIFSSRPKENGSFCNTLTSQQQHPFRSNTTSYNDQHNFGTSSSGLSFRCYSKNNGINYPQQQSLLQVTKELGCREATIPLKQCKLKCSVSSGTSNSKNTSVAVDATSSFSTSHPPQRTSTTSCTTLTADKASHDSSRINNNVGSCSHEIARSKDDEIVRGGADKIQFRNNCSESSSSSISSSSSKCSTTTSSISLINSPHQQLIQQPQNSSKTEMTNLTAIPQTQNAITSLTSGNCRPSCTARISTSMSPSQNTYPPIPVVCSTCEEDTVTKAIINPTYNVQQPGTPLVTPTVNGIDSNGRSVVTVQSLINAKEQTIHQGIKDRNTNYSHNKSMEYTNSSHDFTSSVATQQNINQKTHHSFKHHSLPSGAAHSINIAEGSCNSRRYKNDAKSQQNQIIQPRINQKIVGNSITNNIASSSSSVSLPLMGENMHSQNSTPSYNSSFQPHSSISAFQDGANSTINMISDQEMAIDKESRNSCSNTFTSRVKQSKFAVGQDDQCNRQNEKRAEEQEKLFVRPPSVQSLPTLSSTTSNSSFTSSFVASNQTFTSSLSTSQRPQATIEKIHEETRHKEKTDETNQQPQSIAERLLQQCLVPVPVQPLDPTTGNNTSSCSNNKERNSFSVKRSENNYISHSQVNCFRCRICHKNEQISKLLYHASHAHNILDLTTASKECMANYPNRNKDAVNNNDPFRPNHSNSPVVDFNCIDGTTGIHDEYVNHGGSRHQMSSPPWCEGAFPSDLEDVALSPPSAYNNDGTANSSGILGLGNGNLNCGVGFSTMEDMASSSCSPPSVGDLTSLNPQDHFDPDFDVVDEMKFIDCLIQTIEPTSDNMSENNNTGLSRIALSHSSRDEGAQDDAISSEEDTKPTIVHSLCHGENNHIAGTNGPLETSPMKDTQLPLSPQVTSSSQSFTRHYPKTGAIVDRSNVEIYPNSIPSCMAIGRSPQSQTQQPIQTQLKMSNVNAINVNVSNPKLLFQHHHHNGVALPPPIPAFMSLPSNVSAHIHHNQQSQQAHTLFCNPTLKPQMNVGSSNNDFAANKMSGLPSSTTHANDRSGSSVAVVGSNKINSQKSSPQFRWRRRKRRSKAQYPEMSQYLVPIDEGDEIQHLGRTLECTLCGLRGKRCHLTLHFKAKHSEVIDLHIPGRSLNATATQVTVTANK